MNICLRTTITTLLLAAAALSGAAARAQALTVSVDPPSPQPVGTPVTISVTGDLPNPFDLRVSEISATQPRRILYDFSDRRDYEWARLDEGWHVIDVVVRDRVAGTVTLLDRVPYQLTPLATDEPVVQSTSNPLVALYGTPPCAAGNAIRVSFRTAGALRSQRTPAKPCRPGRSVSFHVAGMRESTVYELRYEVLDSGGNVIGVSPPTEFLAGVAAIEVDSVVLDPADGTSSLFEGVLVQTSVGPGAAAAIPFATDLGGQLIWYLDTTGRPSGLYTANRMLDGGGLMLRAPGDGGVEDQRLWQIDLAGNVVRETTVVRVSEQLVAMGQDPITGFHHDSTVLPDGRLAVLGYVERILTDVQGPGDVDVLADMIMVLDQDLQVVWVWNAFDHLDATRLAVLGETCVTGQPGCPDLQLAPVANDWLHSNAVAYSDNDGSLILSVRHQDWVVKIDYQDGSGDGQVLWRLGPEGDFELLPDAAPGDIFPWFSHQHDAHFLSANEVLLYDNANTRCDLFGTCESRGQIYTLDETVMEATLSMSIDLGRYSFALGSAQRLVNGNLHFDSGAVGFGPDALAVAQEFLADGTLSYEQSVPLLIYRSFRVRDLYSPP